jgi:hypothetical protein
MRWERFVVLFCSALASVGCQHGDPTRVPIGTQRTRESTLAGLDSGAPESSRKRKCPAKPDGGTGEPAPACPTDAMCRFADYPDAAPGTKNDPKPIQAAMRDRYDTFRKCYDAALAKEPCLEGRVGIRFVINAQGQVACVGSADQPGRIRACEMERCIHEETKNVSFPAPGHNIKVVYPIMFAPG